MSTSAEDAVDAGATSPETEVKLAPEPEQIGSKEASPHGIQESQPSSCSPKAAAAAKQKEQDIQQSTREMLIDFYKKHNPEKLHTIDAILESYKGNEHNLMPNLRKKYNIPEPKKSDEKTGEGAHYGAANTGTNLTSMATSFLGGVLGTGTTTTPSTAPSTPSQIQPGPNANSDEILFTNRINGLQSEVTNLETQKSQNLATIRKLKSQVNSLTNSNTKLTTEAGEMRSRIESLQQNLVSVVDRETVALREKLNLAEQLRANEATTQSLHSQLTRALKQKDAKHTQLKNSIECCHRLGAQVRFLASYSVEQHLITSNPSSQPTTSSGTDVSAQEATSGLGDSETVGLSIKNAMVDEYLNEAIERLKGQFPSSTVCNTTKSEENQSKRTDESVSAESKDSKMNAEKSSCDADATDDTDRVDKVTQVAALEAQVMALSTANVAARIELRLALQQNSMMTQRTSEQQGVIEGLQKKLSDIVRALDSASGSADSLRRQIADTSADLSKHKTLLMKAENTDKEKAKALQSAQAEISKLREMLLTAEGARKDLANLFSEHARQCQSHAVGFVSNLLERVLIEREDATSRLYEMSVKEREARALVALEMQRETQRMREELFRSRRGETQKENEVVFLQRQLVESAEHITNLTIEVNEKVEMKKEMDDLKDQVANLQRQIDEQQELQQQAIEQAQLRELKAQQRASAMGAMGSLTLGVGGLGAGSGGYSGSNKGSRRGSQTQLRG